MGLSCDVSYLACNIPAGLHVLQSVVVSRPFCFCRCVVSLVLGKNTPWPQSRTMDFAGSYLGTDDRRLLYQRRLFLLPLVESVGLCHFRTTGARAVLNLFLKNLVYLIVIFISTTPTLWTRKVIFGGYLRFGSYSHLGWDWSAPYWRRVLLSSDHGLLSWTPIVGFALLGLLFAPRSARVVAGYFALAAAAFYYLIASYPFWDGLSSFGNRFFISLTCIFIFGLALLLEFAARRFSSQRTSFVLLSVLLTCFAMWNFGFIFQWGAHLIPVRGPFPGARWPTTNSLLYLTKSPCNFVPTYFGVAL